MPMTKKILFGVSLATLFAISVIFAQSVTAEDDKPDYLKIKDTSVTYLADEDGTFLKAEIKTEGKIKETGAYGYGLLTDGGNNVLALTTHMCASDSPYQGNAPDKKCPNPIGLLDEDFTRDNDGKDFHAHVLDLMPYTSACKTATGLPNGFEVDVANSINTNGGVAGVSPDYPVKASGETIRIGNVPTDVLGSPSTVPTIVSFEIVPVYTGSSLEHLCLINVGN